MIKIKYYASWLENELIGVPHVSPGFNASFILYLLGNVFSGTFPAIRLYAFGNHHDGIRFSFLQSVQNSLTNIMDIIRNFGYQDNITATCHT